MSQEVDLAIELGIKVVAMTEATKRELGDRWQKYFEKNISKSL